MAGDSLLRVRGRLRRGRLGAGLRAPFGAALPLPVRFGSRLVFLGGGQNRLWCSLEGVPKAICGRVSSTLGQTEREGNGLCRGPVSVIDRGG